MTPRAETPLLSVEQALAWFGEPRYSVTDLQRAYAEGYAAARSSPAPAGLDAAWAEAEAALPEGWVLWKLHQWRTPAMRDPVWQAIAGTVVGRASASGEGFDRIAALRALAPRLQPPVDRDAPREDETPRHPDDDRMREEVRDDSIYEAPGG